MNTHQGGTSQLRRACARAIRLVRRYLEASERARAAGDDPIEPRERALEIP